jgi:hypothetical protein
MKAQEILNAPDQPPLSDDTVVWRYMGFDKFIYLLANEWLYFSRLTNLLDKEEMMIPVFNELREMENGGGCLPDYNAKKEKCDELVENIFVNCWAEGDGESFAQWKIYGEAGVAVKSTVAHLKRSIQFRTVDPKEVFITRVNYANSVDNLDLHKLVGTKRKPYTFENEIRMYFEFDEGWGGISRHLGHRPLGREIKIDLDVLIDSIYISPFAGQWMIQPVRRLLSKMGRKALGKKVDGSDIRLG